jgi:O-antigen/teichoic acid export membrane protein
MQRKFITNLALLLFLNLLIKPFWILGIDREVQNLVGAEAFGLYYALFNFSFLINALLDVGITNFNNKNIAQNTHLLTKHFSHIVGLKLVLALVYTGITIICAMIVGYKGGEIKMLLILILNQFLIYFLLYLRSNISGLHLFKTDSLISVLDRSIMIVICGILLWGGVTDEPFQIEWFIYAQTAGYGLTALTAFWVVLSKTESFRLTLNIPFYISILKQSYPFAVLILLMTIYTKSDTIIMERMLPNGAEQTGIFAQAYRILDAANMIGFLFAGLLLPLFARMIKLKETINQLVVLSLSLILSLAIITAAGSFVYRVELMDLLYQNHVFESSRVFGVLMFSFVAISISYIFGTLLTANGSLRQLNYIALFGVILNVGLNFMILPKLLALGAAVSGLITNSLMAVLQIGMAALIFKFRFNNDLIVKIFVFALGCIAIAYFSRSLPFGWFSNFIIMGIACVGWAFIARLLSIKGIYRIVKYD